MFIRALAIVWALFLAFVFGPPSAHAQPTHGTVVLAVRTNAADDASIRAAKAIEASLARRGVGLVSMHEARDRFVSRSRAPLGPGEGDIDVLAREARSALEHVAFGRTQAAQRAVKEVLARAERSLESLNRETDTARQVLDACLALVRSALQTNDRRAALDQAASCRRLVPDVAPNHSLHPASVIGVLAEADDQLRRMRTGHLQVFSAPENACAVYLNGRHLGSTPFTLERAVTGSYRVQVECGEERGRVHLIELGDEPTELRVDTQLDRAIISEPRLVLTYATRSQLEKLLVDHAAQIGRATRAENVVVVHAEGSALAVSRVSVPQARLLGRVQASSYNKAELEKLLDAVLEGRIDAAPALAAVDEPALASASPATAQETATQTVPPAHERDADSPTSLPPAPRDASEERAPWKLWTGGALAVAAAGALAAGIFFEQRVQSLDDDLGGLPAGDPAISSVTKDYNDAKGLRWIGVGGVLSVGTVALLAKSRPAVPWWSYVITGAGVALAGVGIYELATTHQCTLTAAEGFCIEARNSEGRGILMLTASTPLLATLPTHFLLREKSPERATIGIFPGRHGARAVLSFAIRGL
jgi:hypothetical protein